MHYPTLLLISLLTLTTAIPTPLPQTSCTPPTKAVAIPTIRIQVNGISGEDARQFEVPADKSVFSFNGALNVFTAQVIDDEGLKAPNCFVFSDLAGLEIASEIAFGTVETALLLGSVGTVVVGSVKCTSQ